MTIRFTCAGCGSLLKIKDELAGTEGKCPKCKTEFVVPGVEDEADSAEMLVSTPERATVGADHKLASASDDEESKSESAPTEDAEEKPEKPAKVAAKKGKGGSSGDDFDPADFLMEDEKGSKAKKKKEPAFAAAYEDDHPMGPDNRSRRPPKSGTIAATGSSDAISASAHAKEMMMKAMEDSRTHAGEMPVQPEKEGFDYSGFFQEVGLKWGGGLLFGIVLTIGLYFVFDSMFGSRLKMPPLGYVTGTVTLDGTPLPGARVYFAPKADGIEGSKRERPRTSIGMTDDKGHYKMYYIDTTQGVASGKCRVWLSCIGPKGEMIPADFTEGTYQEREVKSGSQVIDFPLTSPK